MTGLDVLIELLITIAILLIGQATMVYEVFSSIPLPRSGLRKRWFFAIWSGGIFALVLSGVLIYFARPELAYLVFIPFLTGAMTWQNRQAAREQELAAKQMRTLAQPRQTYERIFANVENNGDDVNILAEFDLICSNFLRTKKALLMPMGVLSSFLPTNITYPRLSLVSPDISVPSIVSTENLKPIPLNPENSNGFHWAIPLISARGQDGWFFIAERLEGGFYTLEEIEIARAAVERWMDNQASAEIARRLVILQQQKLSETRLLDQKARRVLHDDILPLLHTALLADPKSAAVGQITEAHQQISRLLRDAPLPAPTEIATQGLFAVLENFIHSESDLLKARLDFQVDDDCRQAAANLPPNAAETIFYAVRECLRNIEKHASPRTPDGLKIWFKAAVDTVLQISIENNGAEKEIGDELFSTSGQGIRLHNAMLAVYGGGMRIEKLENGNTCVTISLPLSNFLISRRV